MKHVPSLSGLIVSAIAILLFFSSYHAQEISLFVAEGSISPLKYPRFLLGILAVLGLVLFIKNFRTRKNKSSINIGVILLGVSFILYYYAFLYLNFYFPTVFLCAVIAFLIDRKLTFSSAAFCLLLPLGVWGLFVYVLGLQIQFV
jgi:hypothetical protein